LGLYDYCALVPVLEGAGGGVISDWTGASLTLSNHEKSKGRVLASANPLLHRQALDILNIQAVPSDDILDEAINHRSNNGHLNSLI